MTPKHNTDDEQLSFGERMRIARERKKNNDESPKDTTDPKPKPTPLPGDSIEGVKIIRMPTKESLPELDWKRQQWTALERTIIAYQAIAVLLSPLLLLGTIFFFLHDIIISHWRDLLLGVGVMALFIGTGNMAFDFLSKAGLLHPINKFLLKNEGGKKK